MLGMQALPLVAPLPCWRSGCRDERTNADRRTHRTPPGRLSLVSIGRPASAAHQLNFHPGRTTTTMRCPQDLWPLTDRWWLKILMGKGICTISMKAAQHSLKWRKWTLMQSCLRLQR
ncbi:hypothetical protein BaRGS_00035924, partial [Batillaria attramentaria]